MLEIIFFVLLSSKIAYADHKRILVDDNDYLETRLKALEINLRQDFETKILQMNNTIQRLETEVERNGEHVAFYATLSAHVTAGQKQTIIFDKILTNIGHAYSGISGVFTAPKTGLYHFSTTMFCVGSTSIHTQIMMNNSEIGKNYGNSNASSGTVNVIVTLQKDDQVYIRHMEGRADTQSVYGNGYSSFSGFLIE